MVSYLIDIQETPIQVQAPLVSPLLGLPFPDLNYFRDFDQHFRTVHTFSLDQMATGNDSQGNPPVVTLVADMVGSSAVAQQLVPIATQQPIPIATQQPMPSAAQ